MDAAEADRTDQNDQRIVAFQKIQRKRERHPAGKRYGCEVRHELNVLAEPAADHRHQIAEEAVDQEAHDKGRDTAFDQESGHVAHGPLRSRLFAPDHARDEHQQAVCHIREHDSEEQCEERHDERIRIQSVVSGERIHLGHDVVRSGQPVVPKLDRNLFRLLRIRILCLPCAGVFPEHFGELFFFRCGDPPLHPEGALRFKRLLLRLFSVDDRLQRLQSHLEIRTVLSLCGNGRTQFLFALCEFHKSVFRRLCDLLRRPLQAGHGDRGERSRSQRGDDIFCQSPVIDHVHEAELLIFRYHSHLRIQIREQCPDALDAFTDRDGTVDQLTCLRRALSQVLIHFDPRFHGCDGRLLTVFLSLDAPDLHVAVQYVLGSFQIAGDRRLIHDRVDPGFRKRCEQALPVGRILIETGQRIGQGGLLRPQGDQRGRFLDHRVHGQLRLLLRLVDLYAAQQKKILQDFLSLGRNRNELQFFHRNNAHLPFNYPFFDETGCRCHSSLRHELEQFGLFFGLCDDLRLFGCRFGKLFFKSGGGFLRGLLFRRFDQRLSVCLGFGNDSGGFGSRFTADLCRSIFSLLYFRNNI